MLQSNSRNRMNFHKQNQVSLSIFPLFKGFYIFEKTRLIYPKKKRKNYWKEYMHTHTIFSGLYSSLHFTLSTNILLAFFVCQFLALRYLDIDSSEQSTGYLSAIGPIIFLTSFIWRKSNSISWSPKEFFTFDSTD